MSNPASGAASAKEVGRRRSRQSPFTPKLITCLREGYSRRLLIGDVVAGLTVGVVALPLAIALGIASKVEPERGLYTAVIAGFLISLLGGSRVQIGGPTAAFIAIVGGVVMMHGYDGLVIATLMAGAILVIMGLARFGGMIKFIPYPVTTGFTAGIAVLIFTTQVGDLLGLRLKDPPLDFLQRWALYFQHFGQTNGLALGIGLGGIALILLLRKLVPRAPGYLIAVALAAGAVAIFDLDNPSRPNALATIGSAYATPEKPFGIPQSLPSFSFPEISWETLQKARQLIPEATTIAVLAAIESLLCAVVADGMIGGRHKSNLELVAQGSANIASALFGGIPATGAIARTATNVRAGGRTPIAGMLHAGVVLLLMLVLAPWARFIPMAILASVLIVVAWGMSEKDHFLHLFSAPKSDVAVLLTTFGLTVLTDLTIAVGVGMVLAAMLFMKRMSDITNVAALKAELSDEPDQYSDWDDPNSLDRRSVPAGVEVYEINGPFFFGVADRLKDTLEQVESPPKVFILRMRRVPTIDATGMHALDEFHGKCVRAGTRLLLAGIHAQPIFAMTRFGLLDRFGEDNLFANIDEALAEAARHVGATPPARPSDAQPEVARERQTS